jgi:hypothetical protein
MPWFSPREPVRASHWSAEELVELTKTNLRELEVE